MKKFTLEIGTVVTKQFAIEAENEESAWEIYRTDKDILDPISQEEVVALEHIIGVEDIESDDMDDDSDNPLVQEGEKVEPSENQHE